MMIGTDRLEMKEIEAEAFARVCRCSACLSRETGKGRKTTLLTPCGIEDEEAMAAYNMYLHDEGSSQLSALVSKGANPRITVKSERGIAARLPRIRRASDRKDLSRLLAALSARGESAMAEVSGDADVVWNDGEQYAVVPVRLRFALTPESKSALAALE